MSLAELRAHGPQQLRSTRMGDAGGASGAAAEAEAAAAEAEQAAAEAARKRSGAEAAAECGAPAAAAAPHPDPDPRLWMALNGRVYDITAYLPFHPGGAQILEKASGTDATALFQRYHPWVNVGALLEACCLGRLGGGGGAGAARAGAGPGGGSGGSSGGAPSSSKAPAGPSSLSAGVRSLFGRGAAGGP